MSAPEFVAEMDRLFTLATGCAPTPDGKVPGLGMGMCQWWASYTGLGLATIGEMRRLSRPPTPSRQAVLTMMRRTIEAEIELAEAKAQIVELARTNPIGGAAFALRQLRAGIEQTASDATQRLDLIEAAWGLGVGHDILGAEIAEKGGRKANGGRWRASPDEPHTEPALVECPLPTLWREESTT